jgi:hypothetical protein
LNAPAPSGVSVVKNSVGSLLITSANTRKFAAPRGMSMWLAIDTGLPVSAISAARKSSKRRSISSATAWSMALRSLIGIDPHAPPSAARAAFTAASTSAFEASWTMPISEPSSGERFSNVAPEPPMRYSPSMKFWNSVGDAVDIARLTCRR